jgi:YSIRK-targeted surface antigen transcriptional regulator
LNSQPQIIKSKCELITNTFDLATFFVPNEAEVSYEYLHNRILNPLYNNEEKSSLNILQFDSSKSYSAPIIRKTAFFEKFITISVTDNDQFLGNLIIGPSITNTITDENINGLINDAQAFFKREDIFNYYNSVPAFPLDKLISISVMINYLLNGELINTDTVLINNKEVITPAENNERLLIDNFRNANSQPFQDRLFEKQILSIVKEGRVDALENPVFVNEEGNASAFSKTSYLRSLKTHIVTLITLVARAAIDGGLNAEKAFRLNERYIQRLERINDVDEVKKMAKEMLFTFTTEVKQIQHERYSKTISMCIDYVVRHLYTDFAHEDIAEYVHLSPKYLSVLFKKEVGMSLTDYIRLKRIEEAKKLLKHSQTPIPEICSYLNFYDQSYFTKVFKKLVGVTPKQYREKHHLQKE